MTFTKTLLEITSDPLTNLLPITDTHTDTIVDGPELDWCPDCCTTNDPLAEPGMAQVVISREIEEDPGWDTELGQGPEYLVTRLACGHTLAELC